MSSKYNTNHSKEEIEEVLKKIKNYISKDMYTISLGSNREENNNFIATYNISSKKRKAILLNIGVEDFCYSLISTNPNYLGSILYVFCPQVDLFDIDDEKIQIDIYVKFDIVENDNQVVVISFHERNDSITYLFR